MTGETVAIESLADLRAGDLMFGPIGGWVGVGVGVGQLALGEGFSVGRVKIRHAGVVVEPWPPGWRGPRLVQAMPHGAEQIELVSAKHWKPAFAYCRPNYASSEAGWAVAQIGQEMVRRKVGYSFATYPALAAWKLGVTTPRLTGWIDRRDADGFPREAICSQLVDDALTMAGFQVFADGRPERCVTPGQLAGQFLFRHPGTIWGGPAWSGQRVGPFTSAPR